MMCVAGILLIMGASLWFGLYFAMKEKYRLQELEELERGIYYLQGQIQYLSSPLAEALESVGWRTGGQVGSIFQKAAEKMAARRGRRCGGRMGAILIFLRRMWRRCFSLDIRWAIWIRCSRKTVSVFYCDISQKQGRREGKDWRKTAGFTTLWAVFRGCSWW